MSNQDSSLDLDVEDSKYTGKANEEYTRENPLGGHYVYPDDTSSGIISKLHDQATKMRSAILGAKDFIQLKAVFVPYYADVLANELKVAELANEMKNILNYINSPIADFLHINLTFRDAVKSFPLSHFPPSDVIDDEPVKIQVPYKVQSSAKGMKELFFRACIMTDIPHLLRFLIDRGADIYADDYWAVQLAATYGNLKIIKFLICNGLSCTAEKKHKFYSALKEAARYGHLPVVKLLIDVCSTTGLEVPKEEFRSIAQAAVDKDHIHVVEYMYKLRVNEFDVSGLLYSAVLTGSIKVVKFLVPYVDLNIGSPADNLYWAARCGHLPVVKCLVEHGARNINEAFVTAAWKGFMPIVQYLFDIGADIHHRNDEAFRLAVAENRLEAVKFLVEKGVDIHTRDNTPWRDMITDRYHDFNTDKELNVLKFLLEKNEDQVFINKYFTPLAAQYGRKDILQLLIEYKADIHYDKDMPLFMAVVEDKVETVQFLLDAGAYTYDVNGNRYNKDSPTEIMILCDASRNNSRSVVQYLAERFPYERPMHLSINAAASSGHVKILDYLLSLKCNANYILNDALELAMENNRGNVVNYIVQHLKDRIKFIDDSILMSAAWNNYSMVVKFAVQYGNFTNKDYEKASANAMLNKHDSIAQYLFDTINSCYPVVNPTETPETDQTNSTSCVLH